MLLDRIRAYYDACNSGDEARVAACFTPDAVHYFTRLGPLRGADAIASHTRLAVEGLQARWEVVHGIERGDEACIEWTMRWRDPRRGGEARVNHGTEWFVFRDELIAQVRAYHHGDAANPTGELLGYGR